MIVVTTRHPISSPPSIDVHFPSFRDDLSLPHPLDSLCQANVVGLKLVQTDANQDSGGVEGPHGELAGLGETAVGDIVDEDILETGVRVHEDCAAESGIEHGVQRTGSERSDGQGDEAGGEQTVKGPVVGAVRGRRRRDGSRVID